MEFWLWLFVVPAIALALLSLRGERKRARYVAARLSQNPVASLPPASVIVPVKGPEEGLRENLASLAALDYPDFELLITARTAGDIAPGVLPAHCKIVLAGDGSDGSSEKVHNLRIAVKMTRKPSQVFAFADSDGRAPRLWLRALVEALEGEGVGASTGYRWYTPQPPDFWSLMRSVWNAAIAGTLGPGPAPFVWGGSMAIRRDVFYDIGVPEYWRGAVSDDYMLTSAVRDAGLQIVFAPGAMVASTDHITMRAFLSWARRQMVITRVYHPGLWWPALAAHVVYCGGMAAAIAASVMGNRLAEWTLIAQLSPGMLKGANRATLAKAELPEQKAWFDRHGWVHTWFVPLATWVWLIALAGSAFGDTIHWRGRRYVLKPLPNGRGSLTDPSAVSVRPPTEPRP
jgi:ceramide glucosyltransferase